MRTQLQTGSEMVVPEQPLGEELWPLLKVDECLPLGEGSYLEAFLGDGEFTLTSRRGTHSGAETAPQLKARGGPYPHPKTRADAA